MNHKVAIYGASFNPPGLFHRYVARMLSTHFAKVIVLPCGPRPDKPATNDVEPYHRAAMVDIAFQGLDHVEVDLSDLEASCFTPNIGFAERYGHLGEIWHVVPTQTCHGGAKGQSEIQRHWHDGERVWNEVPFCVISSAEHPIQPEDLPPNNMVVHLETCPAGGGVDIRKRIFQYEHFENLVLPQVARYIKKYALYKGRLPSRRTLWKLENPRLLVICDQRNPRAVALSKRFAKLENPDEPEGILVLGGDGTMLQAIRQHWRRRLPFLGINQGHIGFLLNEMDESLPQSMENQDWILRQMPMLFTEVEGLDGSRRTELAFNDAWLERTTSQSAWIEVTIQGQVKIAKMVGDGALVCTAAGSTAYARAMGVAPLLADTPGWMLVGSNVMFPAGWKSALLAPEHQVELLSLGGDKRPLRAFADGRDLGIASRMVARLSRIATVELAFCRTHDMAEKISRIQFPQG